MNTKSNTIKSISILGSGWLGLPLAKRFSTNQYFVKVSTRTASRLSTLKSLQLTPSLIDLESMPFTQQEFDFFDSDILIINIPHKDLSNFQKLVRTIEQSGIKKVLFVSSTSVYENCNKIINEFDGLELESSPLRKIEKLFINNKHFESTIVRFSGLFGNSRNPANFFRNGKKVQQADSPVNMIHLSDCLNIIYGLVNKNVWGDAYNCCADAHPTKKAFYSEAAKNSGLPIPEFVDSTITSFKIINNAKIKKHLDYEFVHGNLLSKMTDT